MIRLESLFDCSGRKRRKKLLGRGPSSGHGKTSGRGHKGDGSRSGYKRRFGYEGGGVPLYRRVPTRGSDVARFASKVEEVTTERLDAVFQDGDEISLLILKEKRMVSRAASGVKIILKGDLAKKFVCKDSSVRFSLGAQSALGIS
ncbi:50S ribosomal protein L15 [Chlamydiifrater phoenicopteri]|uniref:50S ribosomal protein L15 n=1 Tax=Chlamydiifrater phoenicopteri TaxID=2681469 RepID=UPI001BCCD5A0|nr:50S ribosomal protein L15 [Chlamydiifrater phoenicopteri]